MSVRDDDDTKPRRRRAPLPPAAPPAAAEPVVLSLRDVAMPPPPDTPVEQTDSEFVLSDDEVQPEPWLGDPDAERAAQRAARRAQVRRDRFRGATAGDAEADVPQVLVIDADETSRAPLCALLESFGFAVTPTGALPAAEPPWPYVAMFVDGATRTDEGGDAIELAKQLRALARELGDTKSVLVLVAQALSSVDRVRAGLAGCDETVLKPLARGNVARALDVRGVALPSDSRRV